MTSSDTPPPHAGPELSRRTVLKTGAGATAAATVGTGAIDDLDPVGEADAAAATIAIVSVAVAAGVTYKAYNQEKKSIDTSDALEDQIISAAQSTADGREPWVEEMQTQFVDRATNSTPYANAAWQEIRAAAAKEIVNGGSQADAESAAFDALDEQTTRSIVNVVERWNAAIKGMAPSIIVDVKNGLGKIRVDGNSTGGLTQGDSLNTSGYTAVDLSPPDLSPQDAIYETSVSPPMDPTKLDGRDEPLVLYGVRFKPGTTENIIAPSLQSWGVSSALLNNSYIKATHSDLPTVRISSAKIYDNVLSAIQSAYDAITNDLPTYVGELYNGLTEGAIDASNILSPEDIVNEFASSSEQSRLAAEIMAIGGSIPGEVGYQAEISHPDLASEKLWGWLYPQFGESSAVNITPGTTLDPADYDMAYFGYDSAVDDSFETRVLSGDKKLTVHQVDGISGQENAATSDSNDSSTGTNGGLTIWDPDATEKTLPEMLETPSEYAGWGVRIDTPDGTTVVPISDISEASDGSYKLDSTPIPEGTTVDSVEIVPGADYQQPVENVSDATTVGSQEVIALIEEQQKTVEELKEALDTSSSIPTGGLLDGGIPTLPGLGVAGTAGAVILGLFGLNAATS